MPRPPATGLSPLESRIMDIVWRMGEATADDITKALGGDLTNASVRTLLRRMEAKAHLEHRVSGRSFVYVPTMDRQDAGRTAISRVVSRFYRGSMEQLLMGLVEGKMIDRRQLEKLSKKVAAAEAAAGRTGKGRK